MPVSPGRHAHQHVAVTGAGTGIGRAVARRLAAEGARVTLMARDEARLKETAEQILRDGGQCYVVQVDIRDKDHVDRAFQQARDAEGPLRALIANAGIGGENRPGQADRWSDIVRTNLDGTYYCLRAAHKHLADEGLRHLVVTSSILARIGVPGYTAYCASKAGLLGLVRAMAVEYARDDVQVNAICPGWVETEMAWQGLDAMAAAMGIDREQAVARAMKAVPAGRMSKPEDIASLVAWLISEDARGMVGQAIDMNNGAFMI